MVGGGVILLALEARATAGKLAALTIQANLLSLLMQQTFQMAPIASKYLFKTPQEKYQPGRIHHSMLNERFRLLT